MPTGKPGSNPPQEFICELCETLFVKTWYPSQVRPRFCSILCRQRNNSQQRQGRPQSEWKGYNTCLSCGSVGKREGNYCAPCSGKRREQTQKTEALTKSTHTPNPPQEFVCAGCGKTFSKVLYPSRKRPKFCSSSCRKKRIIAICQVCSTKFETHQSRKDTRKHCSRKCMGIAIRRKEKECMNCGKVYHPSSPANKGYCSVGCAMTARKETRLKKICEHCGAEFIVRKGYTHARFCSMKCSAQSLARYGPDNPNWKGGQDSYRGKDWPEQSEKARKRDGYACRQCGTQQTFPALSVHHITPSRYFNGDHKTANELTNLITLCRHCHGIAEASIKDRDELGHFDLKAL